MDAGYHGYSVNFEYGEFDLGDTVYQFFKFNIDFRECDRERNDRDALSNRGQSQPNFSIYDSNSKPLHRYGKFLFDAKFINLY